MTKIYLGANLYEVYIGHRVIQFSGDELEEFCEEAYETISKLEAENYELEQHLFDRDGEVLVLMEQLQEYEKEIE